MPKALEMITKKQVAELMKVRDGQPYTKRHDFWASLCRASIVNLICKPNHSVKMVEITEWGKVVLNNELER